MLNYLKSKMRLICKHTHNAFKKGEVYEGIEVHNAIMFIREEDQKKFFYGLKRQAGVDFIGTWFWTLEEWREKQLEELGLND
jgi:hypothetical protein